MSPATHPLASGRPAAWSTEWGEDRFGVFAAFTVGPVAQRLRWVPPGRFWMGSPETEVGRWEDEGPQHEVEITRGFWFGDTPCTQALWQAVTGHNPSTFRSPDRPVENVSWADCQDFLAALRRLVPTLDARLPTEAEWEYACRAGTTTATWTGALDVRGPSHAPVLDSIAWYGGNSGHGFELGNGYDSSSWPGKQYPHTRAGTRPVRAKRPNALGLFDMLGNVGEWCEDRLGRYPVDLSVDPTGPGAGASRVHRGGSWLCDAVHVRAAFRNSDAPGRRSDGVGVRIAASRGPT
jgi:formylglycine-generating enzyme required for sulfatase activity